MTTYEHSIGVDLTIKRPSGATETVRHPTAMRMNDNLFAQIKAQTKAAGRGDVISYKNITETREVVLTEADKDIIREDAIYKAMTLNGKTF